MIRQFKNLIQMASDDYTSLNYANEDADYNFSTLNHRFWFRNTKNLGMWAEAVFKDVYSLTRLETNLETLAFPKNADDLNGFDPYAMVLGDGWEAFNEILLKTFGMCPKIGINTIRVLRPNTIGCDFSGLGANNKPATVQSKYKGAGHAWEVDLAEGPTMKLERFRLQSIDEFNVDPKDRKNMLVVTNARGINYWTKDNLLAGKVRCLGRNGIRRLVDNNPAFWDFARTLIMQKNDRIVF